MCDRQRPLATLGLLGVVAAMWLVVRGVCGDWSWGEACSSVLVQLGGLAPARVWFEDEWWRVVTAGVLHGGWAHLLANAWSLWVVGPWVERAVGRVAVVGVFVAGCVGGGLASLAWAEGTLVVGASSGLFGLAAALLVFKRWGPARTREVLDEVSLRSLGVALIVMLVIGGWVPVIAQAGHIGGALAGSLLAVSWTPRHGKVAAIGLLLVLGLAAWLAAHPLRPSHAAELRGYEHLAEQRPSLAVEEFERARAGHPDDPELANAVAYALAQSGVELERAERLALQALHTDPDDPDFLDTLGWIYCRRGERRRGLETLRRAEAAADEVIPEIEEHRERCVGE